MTQQDQHIVRPWLWPDRTFGKRESRKLREEHNATVNSHADLLEALEDVLKGMPFGANWDSQGNNPDWLKAARTTIANARP